MATHNKGGNALPCQQPPLAYLQASLSRAKSAVRVGITTRWQPPATIGLHPAAILMHSAPDFSQCPPAPAHISTVRSIRHYINARGVRLTPRKLNSPGGVRSAEAKLPSTGSIEQPSFHAPRTPSLTQPKARPSLHDTVDSRFPPA